MDRRAQISPERPIGHPISAGGCEVNIATNSIISHHVPTAEERQSEEQKERDVRDLKRLMSRLTAGGYITHGTAQSVEQEMTNNSGGTVGSSAAAPARRRTSSRNRDSSSGADRPRRPEGSDDKKEKEKKEKRDKNPKGRNIKTTLPMEAIHPGEAGVIIPPLPRAKAGRGAKGEEDADVKK